MRRSFAILGLLALVGVAPAAAQLDLSRYVALGDSTSAGYTHGGLMDCYQELAWPAVLARQAGVTDFQSPLVSPPGLGPLLELTGLTLVQGQAVPTIVPSGTEPGLPINAMYPYPYDNLGVPGASLFDLLFTTGDIMNLLAGNTDNVMHDLVLRFPVALDPATGLPVPAPAIAQAIALDPTFVTLWIGNNDLLAAVLAGTPIDGVTMTPVDLFAQLYPQALGALVTLTDADVVAFTVLDVAATIPFTTTIPPLVSVPGLGIVPLVGTNGPLSTDTLLTLGASALIAAGYGLPIPGSPPLPDDLNLATGEPGVILRPDEIATISARAAAFNQIIVQTAGQLGVPVFDVNALLREAYDEGFDFGGIELNLDFLLGGIVGYDGIHPQNIGHPLIAARLIDFLNEEFDADIPTVDMSDYLFNNPCAGAAPLPAKSSQVVFSRAAHRRLLELFAPEIKQRALARPSAGRRLGR